VDQSTVLDNPTSLKIIYRPLAELRAFSKNARTHSKHQIRQIAESVKTFGFTNPILIDSKDTIIAGHGRVLAAKFLGSAEVPTIRLEGLTPDQIRAYVIADNKLAENAGWDKSVLAIELQHLLSIDESFDVTVTGFEIAEADLIIQDAFLQCDPDDDVDAPEELAVTNVGDMWILGEHRILEGRSGVR
jgi:ParB-like chromosome segregation protein Spo0J